MAPDALSTGGLDLRYSYRFYDDFRKLNGYVADKVSSAIDLIRRHGPYHPSLHTRKVAGNADGRFRFMNVDDQYRIVAVLEGRTVLFEMVGNHDDTLKRGARATLREYEERLAIDPDTFVTPRRGRAPVEAPSETLFVDEPVSLQQLLAQPENLSDLISGDLFGALEGYRDGTIEDWMIFLSPLQRRAVDRSISGPFRVTGGPGTGKTVVALHRAAQLARSAPPGRRVLMTSFVKNIPETLDGLFERLAPDTHDAVSFRHIHDLALDMLRNRDIAVNPDWNAAKARFDRCFDRDLERAARLRRGGFDPAYVWQEITRVIEGRGVARLDDYLALDRVGRRRGMQAESRRAVWDLYEEYREACGRLLPPLADPERVLQLALEAVIREPTGKPFHAIVVDEAQDVTQVGLRFLLELLEGGVDGNLVLVGDVSQRIYAGGFRLSDVGISVRGRSAALRICYRSTDEIMRAVAELGRLLSSEDYGDDGLNSLSASTVRRGPPVAFHRFEAVADELAWLLEELAADGDPDSIAILVPTNARVDEWLGRLKVGGIPTVRLSSYGGRPTPGVKVGTYARAKGLEFKRVFLSGLDDAKFPWGDRSDVDGMLLQGSMLYVGMSRARDRLDVSYVGQPSYFIRYLVDKSER